MKKIISALFACAFLTSAFHSQSVSKPFVTSEGLSYKFRYLSDDELDLLPSLRADFKDFSDWKLEYTTSKEHDFTSLNEIYDYKLKFFSIVKDSSKNQWLHFTMQAEKDRVSPKGKYPSVKIRSNKRWIFGSNSSLSFKLNTATSDMELGHIFAKIFLKSSSKLSNIVQVGYKAGRIFLKTFPENKDAKIDEYICEYAMGTTMDVKVEMKGNVVVVNLTDAKGQNFVKSYKFPDFSEKNCKCYYELSSSIDKYGENFAEVYIRDFECKVE